MRPIKYRAYLKNEKMMLPVIMLDYDYRGEGKLVYVDTINPSGDVEADPWENRIEDVELMQFTGLHDQDGREIYEGDIISYDWIYNDPDWTYGAGNEPKEVVRWNDKRTGYSPITDQDQFYTIKNIQIQGNIYQNPELLEDTP